MSYRTIDLCAGIGGIRRGFELAGNTENVLSAEIDRYAAATYEHLFGEDPTNDLTTEEFKTRVENTEYDILLAGFPCQPFSTMGEKRGFEDAKGTIFFHIADIIRRTRPKMVFLENVRGLTSNDDGRTFRTVLETLELKLDYKVIGVYRWGDDIVYSPKNFIRDTVNFGLPQHRERVYIIAFDRRAFPGADAITAGLPAGNDLRVYEHFSDLLDADVSIKYYVREDLLAKKLASPAKKGKFGSCVIANEPGVQNPVVHTLTTKEPSATWYWLVYDPREGVSGIPIREGFTNSDGIRHLTPNEYGKLQGFVNYGFMRDGVDTFSFPEEISNTQKYKMFGNSVSIPVIETLARFALDLLDGMS